MGEYLKGLFGAQKPMASPASAGDDADFADFAGAPDPTPASISAIPAQPSGPQAAEPTSQFGRGIAYTKWYRVWERASPRDFYQEGIILPFILLIFGLHMWGRRKNRSKAKSWIKAHGPALEKEYAVVGFNTRKAPAADGEQTSAVAEALASNDIPQSLLKEKTAQEFVTYATGRQNVAFIDIKLTLYKRYNPATLLVEWIMSFFLDSFRPPTERMEATAYAFDGKERDLIPKQKGQEQEIRVPQSSYDNFVWAVVHKEAMRNLRDDRYDISLTTTKDQAKLPAWATTMSESAEITDFFLTPELIKAIETAGDAFEYLVVTDQPLDKPIKLNETTPRKRLTLSLRLPSSTSPTAYDSTTPLFTHFLRLPDTLSTSAHFRPEVQRKIRATRESEIAKLKKVDEEEKAEERKADVDKKKKEMRDSRLKGMSAEEQRKFLEREREKGNRKQERKMSRKA